MQTSQQKFQTLLQQLFRADAADLDFGIYRIINYRREQLQNFIAAELPTIVNEALDANTETETAHQELENLTQQIRQNFGDGVLDADGNLINDAYKETPLVQQYLKAKEKLGTPQSPDQRQDAVYNHLYTFFARYYDNGDFIPRRRYSQTERYAVPYNGQEVYLHWANKDQYYVKSGEHFSTYRFTSQGITVTFDLREADIEKDNVKGEKRFFIPLSAETTYNAETEEIRIPFEHRPLTDEEKKQYSGQKQQDKIIDAAEPEILNRLIQLHNAISNAAVPAGSPTHSPLLAGGLGGVDSSLKKHLRTYTRRNTADFFIHKDLRGFLTRELDVYLKNEVVPLTEIILNNSIDGGG